MQGKREREVKDDSWISGLDDWIMMPPVKQQVERGENFREGKGLKTRSILNMLNPRGPVYSTDDQQAIVLVSLKLRSEVWARDLTMSQNRIPSKVPR